METNDCVNGNNREKPPSATCVFCDASERTAVNWVGFGGSRFSRFPMLKACARNEKCNKKEGLLLIWIKTLLLCWDLHVRTAFKGILYSPAVTVERVLFPSSRVNRSLTHAELRSSVWVTASIFLLGYPNTSQIFKCLSVIQHQAHALLL